MFRAASAAVSVERVGTAWPRNRTLPERWSTCTCTWSKPAAEGWQLGLVRRHSRNPHFSLVVGNQLRVTGTVAAFFFLPGKVASLLNEASYTSQ